MSKAPRSGPPDFDGDLQPAAAGRGLARRLTALARLLQIGRARTGPDGFSAGLLDDTQRLLTQADQRLRLSGNHTVVALAGGTGSGKSALFNQLSGADFSPVGVTRPATRDAHACVWGVAGSGPLLDWLGVAPRYRYARSSALERGEEAMTGLILVDLPDHDSVVTGATSQADRLVGLTDLMIWVLDPQKYADAAVHRRYLVPLAGHSEVIAVVLNQADRLTPQQAEDCLADLRRLLDSEDLQDVPVLMTSAKTGEGLDELRKMLTNAVSARRAAQARISADVDDLARRWAPFGAGPVLAGPVLAGTGLAGTGLAGEGTAGGRADSAGPGTDSPAGPWHLSPDLISGLVEAFSRAAGVSAVGESLQRARELRALDYVGWPLGWLAERIAGRDPARKIRRGRLWEELRSVTAGPSGAQQAEIDNALTVVADAASQPLPAPWSRTTREAARSRAREIPAALGTVMGQALPAEDHIAGWWRLVGALQGLLLGCVIVGLAWIAVIIAFGAVQVAGSAPPRLFSDLALLPWIALIIAAILLLGWLAAAGAMNRVQLAAAAEREQVEEEMRDRMAVTAQEMVIRPIEDELAELDRFRTELRAATTRD
ncbi:MAG TPA: GTPase [Streptosporangiaceae bacterium]|nr:GTPase [Streptosporangiaceae bacterium]